MGIDSTGRVNYPRLVGKGMFTNVIDAACGLHFNLVLDKREIYTSVYLMGLVPGSRKEDANLRKVPYEIAALRSQQVERVYAGGNYAAVTSMTKKVFVWGCLNGATISEPTQILAYESIIDISIGLNHAFALTGMPLRCFLTI